MSKIFRITVASAVVAGVAALSPLSAQARSVTPLVAGTPVYKCNPPGANASETASSTRWTITVPAGVAGATGFKYSAKVFRNQAGGSQVFSRVIVTSAVANADGSVTATGSVPTGYQVYRMDVSDPALEAAGAVALLYTTAGAAACD